MTRSKPNKVSKDQLIIGTRYERLVVLEQLETINYDKRFRFKCDCGTIYDGRAGPVRRGRVKSCGCYHRDTFSMYANKPPGVAVFNELYRTYKYDALRKNRAFELDTELFRVLTSSNCHYCNAVPARVRRTRKNDVTLLYNGVDRKDNNIGYVESNCVSCCTECNYRKKRKSYDEFVKEMEPINAITGFVIRQNLFDAK